MSETPERTHEIISDALDGRLSESEERAFRSRLAGDPELARAWERQVRIRETLLDIGTERAPAELSRRLSFELGEEGSDAVAAAHARRRLHLALFRAAAAVLLLIGAVGTWSLLSREEPRSPEATRMAGTDDEAPLRKETGGEIEESPLAGRATPPPPAPGAPVGEARPGARRARETETTEDDDGGDVREELARPPTPSHLRNVDPGLAVYQRHMRESLKAQRVSFLGTAEKAERARDGDADGDETAVAGALLVHAPSLPDAVRDAIVGDAEKRFYGSHERASRGRKRSARPAPAPEPEAKDAERAVESPKGARWKAGGAKKGARPVSPGKEGRGRAQPPAEDPERAPRKPAETLRLRAEASTRQIAAGFYFVSNGEGEEIVARNIATLPPEAVRELHLDRAPSTPNADTIAGDVPHATGAPSRSRYRIYQLTLLPAQANELVSELETELGSKLRAVGQGTLDRDPDEGAQGAEPGGAAARDARAVRVLRLVVTAPE